MPIAPQLQSFVDDELARSSTLVERAVAGTLQLLRESKDGGLTSSERAHHFDLVEALQRGSATYRQAFIDALRRGVQQELQAQDNGSAAADLAGGGLELMDEARVEIDIEIARATQIIDTTAEWELRELQTFTSTLCGQQHVSAESNPLRPLIYATALWQAACTVSNEQAQRATLLRLSSGVIAGLLKNAWAAASSRLEAQGVEPSIYRTVLLAPGSTPSRSAPQIDLTQPGALGSLLNSMPAAAAAASSAAHGLPAASPAGSGGDGRVVELLSRVFALIQADKQLPEAMRAVLARLQVAALRVALQDTAMMQSHSHPVWQLMDRIGEAGVLYPNAGDKRLAALQTFCEAIAEEISRSPIGDAALFRRALTRVSAFLSEQLQWQLREAQPALASLQHAERREVLELHLSQRLSDQMSSVRASPAIRRFVTGAWAKVLAESMLRHGEQTEPTQTYLKTVDDLLWSLQTPNHPQSRQRLLALLPGLLQRLRQGMSMIDLPAAQQQAVLDELMAVHTEALRPSARPAPAAQTAAEIVQRLRDEVIEDIPLRPFSDSVIDLGSMDTVPADFLATRPAGVTDESAPKRVDALVVGERQRLFLQGRWSRVQLLWRSEQGLYCLYAGESPGRTHSITRRALERLDAAGLMQPLETKPLVQRTVDALLNQLALPS